MTEHSGMHSGEAALVLLAQCERVLVIADWERTQLNTSAWGTCPGPAGTQHSLSPKAAPPIHTLQPDGCECVCERGADD